MKTLLLTSIYLIASHYACYAGGPIILTEREACEQSDLVVIAEVGRFRDIPGDGSNVFEPKESKWHEYGFCKFARADVKTKLLGEPPTKLFIYGGQLGVLMYYRVSEGTFLVLLKQVKGNAYRPADSTYSFMPVVRGKVGWLVDATSSERSWMLPDEALKRINANRSKRDQPGAGQPATQPDDKVPARDRPPPLPSKDGLR